MTSDTISPAAAARQQSIDLANEGIGLSAEPATYESYTEAIITSLADLADAVKRKAMSAMSSCGLYALRRMDLMGILSALLSDAYEDGKAIENVIAILLAVGALRPADYVPLDGDFVVILNPTHVFIVTAIEGNVYTTVQGGERMADVTRSECIEEVKRVYTPATETTVAHFDGREVYRVGDCVTLVAHGSGW